MAHENRRHGITDEKRRDLLKILGVAGAGAVGQDVTDVTLSDLQNAVSTGGSAELAERGRAIRSDLTGTLDTALLSAERESIAATIAGLSEVREQGIPDRGETLYEGLTDSAWPIEGHLTDAGFFASAEANLPRFGSAHIERAAKHLVSTGSLAAILSEVGFDESEQTALMANVASSADQLAYWEPTWSLEQSDIEEVTPEYVPPLQRRAAGGALLWIDGLDKHLRQRKVLITDRMLDDGIRDVRAMLGGFYVLTTAAERLSRGEISDEELTALVSGSTATMIAAQNDLQADLVRISDEMRAPRTRGD